MPRTIGQKRPIRVARRLRKATNATNRRMLVMDARHMGEMAGRYRRGQLSPANDNLPPSGGAHHG